MIQAAKIIGTGMATTGLTGAGIAIGVVFGALILDVARNSSLRGQLFSYANLKFAFADAEKAGIFALKVSRPIIVLGLIMHISLRTVIRIMMSKLNFSPFLYKMANLQSPPKPHSFVALSLHSSLGDLFNLALHFIRKNVKVVLFFLFTYCMLHLCKLPLQNGLYLSVLLIALYKLLFRKIFKEFKGDHVKFDKSDIFTYFLMVIMTLFAIIIGYLFNTQMGILLVCLQFGALDTLTVGGTVNLNSVKENPHNILFMSEQSTPSNTQNPSSSISGQPAEASRQNAGSRPDLDLDKKNELVRKLFSVNPSNSFMDRPWTLTIDERASLDRRFKLELVHYLPNPANYVVDINRPMGLVDNNETLSRQYSSYLKYDEYYFYKMAYLERFKEGLSASDRQAFNNEFLYLRQGHLTNWSQGRLHFFTQRNPSQFSREIISLGDREGLKPDYTVNYYMLPRFMQQSLERSI